MAKKPVNKTDLTNEQAVITPTTLVVPKYKAFSVVKTAGEWKVETLEIQGDEVINKSYSEGGNKALALERFKITIAKEFFLGK